MLQYDMACQIVTYYNIASYNMIYHDIVNYNNSSTNKISKDEVFKMNLHAISFFINRVMRTNHEKNLSIKLTNKDLFTFGFLNQISIELLSSHKINYSTRKFIQKLFSDINLNA